MYEIRKACIRNLKLEKHNNNNNLNLSFNYGNKKSLHLR